MKSFLACLLAALMLLSPALSEAERYPTLSVGASGEEVVRLQQRLLAAGFMAGQADGRYGGGTRDAVARAQQALNQQGQALAVDGIAGQKTLELLYDDEVMRPFIDFTMGASGQRVISLQNRLIDLKYLDGIADGQFGSQTLDALKAFQAQLSAHSARGIAVNGLMDEASRYWLGSEADLAPFRIQAPEFFDDSQPESLSAQFLNAKGAILVNARTGDILFGKHIDLRLYPASTTKMMTLLLAVERGRLDETVTLPASTAEVARDSSLVPVYPGEKMSMRDLLYGLMLRSGNDAANAVAEICAGSVEAFVERMNRRAGELGMKDTHFTNPHGYHDKEHYSTAKDLAILAFHGMLNREFAAIVSSRSHEMAPTGKRGLLAIYDTAELLNPASPYYFEGAFGIKSGYTSMAGFCYVGAAGRGDKLLIAAILNSRTRNRGWDDMGRLFRYGFAKIP